MPSVNPQRPYSWYAQIMFRFALMAVLLAVSPVFPERAEALSFRKPTSFASWYPPVKCFSIDSNEQTKGRVFKGLTDTRRFKV